MLHPLLVMLAAATAHPNHACARFVVDPGPEQGMADAALVTKASHLETGPRDLGTVLATNRWRIVWAAPANSEHGVFFFRGAQGSERLLDIWGGAGASQVEAFRWATRKLHVPTPLAGCFADRLAADGV